MQKKINRGYTKNHIFVRPYDRIFSHVPWLLCGVGDRTGDLCDKDKSRHNERASCTRISLSALTSRQALLPCFDTGRQYCVMLKQYHTLMDRLLAMVDCCQS